MSNRARKRAARSRGKGKEETVEVFNAENEKVNVSKKLFRPDRHRRDSLNGYTAMLSRAYKLAYNVDPNITVPKLRYQYNYNGFAAGIVNVTLAKTWKTDPVITDSDAFEVTDFEKFFNRQLRAVDFWERIQEADRMSMIADWSYLIMRIADGKDPSEPVDNLYSKGGLAAIVEFIPVWSSSMKPEYADGQGKVITHYKYDMAGDQIDVHPDRVITVSKTGRDGVSGLLRTNYHQLVGLDIMVKAAPEARRKNAAHHIAIIFNDDGGGGQVGDEEDEEIQTAVESTMGGNQSALAIEGVKDIKTLNNPIAPLDQDFTPMVQALCAGAMMGFRNLIGNEQGQLASEEDTDIFLENIESRRKSEIDPIIVEILRRLAFWGCIPGDVEWRPKWEPLNPRVTKENSEIVVDWQQTNKIAFEMDQPMPFDLNEIRTKAGLDPWSEAEIEKRRAEVHMLSAAIEERESAGGTTS